MSLMELKNKNKEGSFRRKRERVSENVNEWLEGDEHQGNFWFLEGRTKHEVAS